SQIKKPKPVRGNASVVCAEKLFNAPNFFDIAHIRNIQQDEVNIAVSIEGVALRREIIRTRKRYKALLNGYGGITVINDVNAFTGLINEKPPILQVHLSK